MTVIYDQPSCPHFIPYKFPSFCDFRSSKALNETLLESPGLDVAFLGPAHFQFPTLLKWIPCSWLLSWSYWEPIPFSWNPGFLSESLSNACWVVYLVHGRSDLPMMAILPKRLVLLTPNSVQCISLLPQTLPCLGTAAPSSFSPATAISLSLYLPATYPPSSLPARAPFLTPLFSYSFNMSCAIGFVLVRSTVSSLCST